jgi:hypothetical protein
VGKLARKRGILDVSQTYRPPGPVRRAALLFSLFLQHMLFYIFLENHVRELEYIILFLILVVYTGSSSDS